MWNVSINYERWHNIINKNEMVDINESIET